MKLAVISDIHGNLSALEGVLESVAKESPDRILCLGDVAATGARPREVLRKLKLLRAACIMGNTDASLLKPEPYKGDDPDVKAIHEADAWCSKQLTDSDKDYLRSFTPTVYLDLSGGLSLFAFHGSPRSNKEWIPSTATDEELKVILSGRGATVLAGGHSHKALFRRHLGSILMNPGSVGLPFNQVEPHGEVTLPPWSEFALVSVEARALQISLRRVPFDVGAYGAELESSGIPGGEKVLDSLQRHMRSLLDTGQIV